MRRTLLAMILIPLAIALQTPSECSAQTKTDTATETKDRAGFDVLKGRWLRPDGGYIIQVRNVEGGGKMDAGISTPDPSMFLGLKQSETAERSKSLSS